MTMALKLCALCGCRHQSIVKVLNAGLMPPAVAAVERAYSTKTDSADMALHTEDSKLVDAARQQLVNMPAHGRKAVYDLVKMAVNLKDIKPVLPSKSASLAPYVNDSENLQTLLKLGVDLSKFDKVPEVARKVALSDFDEECKPYVIFLHSLGIAPGSIGSVISKHPEVFNELIENLELRVDYLLSKKFLRSDLAALIEKRPQVLSMPVKDIDNQLGFLQKLYHLSGAELRSLVTHSPVLITWKNNYLLSLNDQLARDLLGLSNSQRKEMVLKSPLYGTKNPAKIQERFEYVTMEMNLPVARVTETPSVLARNQETLKIRHNYLKLTNRTQYDPELPNYIPLCALLDSTDAEFCQKYAHAPLDEYEVYLKTV